jgi:hypothetical protein
LPIRERLHLPQLITKLGGGVALHGQAIALAERENHQPQCTTRQPQ